MNEMTGEEGRLFEKTTTTRRRPVVGFSRGIGYI